MMTATDHKYLTAIILVREFSTGTLAGLKYRNLKNTPAALRRFEVFAAKFNDGRREVIHINYYFKDSRVFSHRTSFSQR